MYFPVIVLSGYKAGSGIAGSYGSSLFSFFRNTHTVLNSGHTNLHSCQRRRKLHFSSHSLQRLLFVDFLIMGILTVGTSL